MGRKSNVNPDHYKTAGRDPQGQSVLQEVERQKFKEGKAELSRAEEDSVVVPRRRKAEETPGLKPLTETEQDRVKGNSEGD
jgi:hypothetical protein